MALSPNYVFVIPAQERESTFTDKRPVVDSRSWSGMTVLAIWPQSYNNWDLYIYIILYNNDKDNVYK